MNPRELETEISMDGDERKVAALLGSLKRVEAPGNFYFGVRARIAAGAPSERSSIFRFVKIAAPLTLVLLVGAFVLFFGSIPKSDTPSVVESGPVVDQPRQTPRDPAPPVIVEETPGDRVSGPNVAESGPTERFGGDQIVPAERDVAHRSNSNSDKRKGRTSSSDVPMRGGSFDQTKNIRKVISPTGIGGDTAVEEVFGMLGIQADFVNNGWKVRAAKQGSIAERSGFQPGDVIESIDGLAVTDKTSFKGGFNGKAFGIRRDGKPMEIKLGN